MKRIFLALLASLPFMSISAHADGHDPVQQIVYNLMVGEELFAQASEDPSITSSSCYINSVNSVIECFANCYPLLPSSCQSDLSGVVQTMEKIGFLNEKLYVAYLNQTTLQVFMEVLVRSPSSLAELIDETGAFIVKYQPEIPFIPPINHNTSDADDLRELSNYLTQLISNPLLFSNEDFMTNLYNSFISNSDSMNNYPQQLMLFNFDLVMAGLYKEDLRFFPPSNVMPVFENETGSTDLLRTLMMNLVQGGNFLFFQEMVSHLQVGINSMRQLETYMP